MASPSQHVRFSASRDGTRIAFASSGAGPPLVRAAHWLSHLDYEPHCPLSVSYTHLTLPTNREV